MAKEKEITEKKLNLPYDWNKLELAQIAGDYLKEGKEGVPFARKSLELMLKDIEYSDPWIVATITDPEVISKSIKNSLREYNVHKKDQTIKEFITYHAKNIEKYVGENLPQFQEELEPFMDKKYREIFQETGKAGHIIEGKEKYGLGSDKEVEAAKKIIEKYQKITLAIKMLEDRKLSQLRNRVEDEITKDSFKAFYTPKEKEGEAEE